jgi:hypothetical protein
VLEVVSSPVGAEVFLGGRRLGVTPYQHATWTGGYDLELRQPGYRPWQQSVSVTADKPAHVEIALESLKTSPSEVLAETSTPKKAAPVRKRPAWRIDVGIVSMAAGALLLGFGAGGLAVNGGCATNAAPSGAACTKSYNTIGVGSSLLAVGGALEIAGAIIIAIPPSKKPAP